MVAEDRSSYETEEGLFMDKMKEWEIFLRYKDLRGKTLQGCEVYSKIRSRKGD